MKIKKEKVLISSDLPPILVIDKKYYATQLYRNELGVDEWWVGDELSPDCIKRGKYETKRTT